MSPARILSAARLAIYNVAYLRGLFDERHFRAQELPQTNGLQMYNLVPKCSESFRLVNIVEQGIIDALDKGYLKAVHFGIASDPEGHDIFEEFVFNVDASAAALGECTTPWGSDRVRQ